MRKSKHAPHPPETVVKAQEMRRKGHTYREIGEAVGASPQTILTWCSPNRDRIRQREKRRKQKYTKPCVDCGGPTSYRKKGYTRRCLLCHLVFIEETKKWTREGVIAAIQKWNEVYGKPPSATDWNAPTAKKYGRVERDQNLYPAATTIYGPHGPFNSWSDAIEAAGFPRPRPLARGAPHKRYWTEERIIEALRAHAQNGYGPKMSEWMRSAPDHPTGSWVAMVFGSWGDALAAAGLEPDPRSWVRRQTGHKTAKRYATLTDERAAFVARCMERNVLKRYITHLMWRKWGYSSENALKTALTRRGVVQEPGWQYRFNRQLTQEEIEEGFSL